jgi:aspartate dehydrogenase
MRLGVIGYGAIGQAIAKRLADEHAPDSLVGILVRPGRVTRSDLPFYDSIDTFLKQRPDVVIEAAGHAAIVSFGCDVVRSGSRLVIASLGVLAEDHILDGLRSAAAPGATIVVSSGAIAGLDGLAAARIAGLSHVTYISYKPPQAWRGTMAETSVDLNHAEDEVTVFAGSAREAARAFPKNANVCAAIALAGIGFDRTQVRLVSSRKVSDPVGVIDADGDFGTFNFEIMARAFPDNPKSSMLTAYALLQSARLGIGIPLAGVTLS